MRRVPSVYSPCFGKDYGRQPNKEVFDLKHRALLRRALPLAVLAAFLFAHQLPATAY